jgi:hypothetical protein
MILRFKSISSEPEYIAINTNLKVWTDCKDIVKQGAVISVAVNHLEHIKKEINFNCFNYSRGFVAVDPEEIPTF